MMEEHQFAPSLVDEVAIAIFDQDETFNLEAIAKMDAEGKTAYGDRTGRERDSWDNPANAHCHDGYRRRAVAALKASHAWQQARQEADEETRRKAAAEANRRNILQSLVAAYRADGHEIIERGGVTFAKVVEDFDFGAATLAEFNLDVIADQIDRRLA